MSLVVEGKRYLVKYGENDGWAGEKQEASEQQKFQRRLGPKLILF